MDPSAWGLERREGRLAMAGVDLPALAAKHGTPLAVADAARLRERAAELKVAFAAYPAPVRLRFSYTANRVAGVLAVLHAEGLGAAVVGGYELWLSQRLGVPGEQVVVNGPNKSDEELLAAVAADVGLLVIDNVDEIPRVERAAAALGEIANVGLRICPDVVAKGSNPVSSSGQRKGHLGMDLPSGEVKAAIEQVVGSPHMRLRGAAAHIGSGVQDVSAFGREVEQLLEVHASMVAAGAEPDLFDIGGGLGARHARELTTVESLSYLGTGRLPRRGRSAPEDLVFRYGKTVTEAVTTGCERRGLPVPSLVLEPGRALVSDAVVLLLTVGATRRRRGAGRFASADGGALSVSRVLSTELHAVLLASRDPADLPVARTSVFGRSTSPADVVYRNLRLPELRAGDVLAVMDAGAYFDTTATNFAGGRPATVLVDRGRARLVQRHEAYEDMAVRELVLEDDSG